MRGNYKNYSLYLLLLCFSFLLFSCLNEEEEMGTIELKVGDYIPNFSILLNDGSMLSSNDLKGDISVIVFFNTSCPDCQKELPEIQKFFEQESNSIQLVCISRSEDSTSVQSYWNNNQLTLPFSAQNDATIYHLFAKSVIPRVYIINQELMIEKIFDDNPIASYSDLLHSIKELKT